MNRPTDVRVTDAILTIEEHPLRLPVHYGTRVIDKIKVMNVEVTLESRDRKFSTGLGSMPVTPEWAWPSEKVSVEQADKVMLDYAERVMRLTDSLDEYGHPIDLFYTISAEFYHLAKVVSREHKLEENLPPLAQLVASSALDAAVHDGFAKLHNVTTFNTLSKEFMTNDLSNYLDEQFAGEYLDQYTLRKPTAKLEVYHLVEFTDPLVAEEVKTELKDHLPVALADWITLQGLRCFKIRLGGNEIEADLHRLKSVDQVVRNTLSAAGISSWKYSIDFNESCNSPEYLLELLEKVKALLPEVFERVEYLAQPANRDQSTQPDFKVHKAAALKPIVIDESYVDYDTLKESRELGYNGVALRASKGLTESLFAAAAAQKMGLFIAVHDTLAPGRAFLQSASIAAHLPGVTSIEGTARQHCPSGNRIWAREVPGMFDIKDGAVQTEQLTLPGLGF